MRTLRIKVKPGAKTSGLEARSDGTWLARIQSPPIDGRANRELVALVARHFGLRQSQVRVKSGTSGRMKLVQLSD